MSNTLITKDDFVHVSRFGLEGSTQDLKMFLAKKLRSTRKQDPEFAKNIELLLKKSQSSSSPRVLRKENPGSPGVPGVPNIDLASLPVKAFNSSECKVNPILNSKTQAQMDSIISEKQNKDLLLSKGLEPSSSAIMVGPPGVGKTISAKWLAWKLNLPLYILDLSQVMSSLLGGSGANLRKVIDYAKGHPSVLFIDEIDAIAKNRSDLSDVGELKRLVNVILQEIEGWNSDGLLLAATNHPELVDRAIWRRFNWRIEFEKPSSDSIKKAVIQYLGNDVESFEEWIKLFQYLFEGLSYSEIENILLKLRKSYAIKPDKHTALSTLIENFDFDYQPTKRIEIAVDLVKNFNFSQHLANRVTGVSRDTIRKKLKA